MALGMLRPEPDTGPNGPRSAAKQRLLAYWNEHVTDWPIATAEPGSPEFFAETEAYRFEKLDYLDRLIDYGGQAGRDVLDVGCGLGNDTARFARGGARVTGIDIAPRAIELSKRNFEQRGLEGRFLVMDGEAMTFPEANFDFVYCHTILHFTTDPAAMIREIHRVLRPGGTALLMSVNRHSWMRLMHRLAKVEIDHLQAPVFNWFSPGELMAMAAPFAERRLVHERFPVATKVHKGLKSKLFNTCFVGLFNLVPRSLVQGSAHHLLIFARKAERAS